MDEMYSTQPLFPYADGRYIILPANLPESFYDGDGEKVYTDNYVICFVPKTSKEIIDRLTKDYAEYYRKNYLSGDIIERYE